jgi:hypothetical protein
VRAAVILTVLSGSACVVFEQLGWDGGGGRVFSHEFHLVSEELECIDCHLDYEDSDSPGWPGLDDCLVCHEDEESETEGQLIAPVAVFFDGEGEFIVTSKRYSEEIIFPHLLHVTDEEGCLTCHGEVAASTELEPQRVMDMTGCVTCHAETGQTQECAACHSQIREDVAPWTHDASWSKFHGQVVRNDPETTVDSCELCHEESSCTSCHQETMPESHNNFWRLRGHGMSAAMDRDSCFTCHRQDYCDRCHQTVTPISHRGTWGSSRNSHCYSCHFGGENSCALCHEGAPSHQLAPPLPPGHDPSSDCRSCHMLLTHVDPGYDCTACHQ